jgi:hypothetical protein
VATAASSGEYVPRGKENGCEGDWKTCLLLAPYFGMLGISFFYKLVRSERFFFCFFFYKKKDIVLTTKLRISSSGRIAERRGRASRMRRTAERAGGVSE